MQIAQRFIMRWQKKRTLCFIYLRFSKSKILVRLFSHKHLIVHKYILDRYEKYVYNNPIFLAFEEDRWWKSIIMPLFYSTLLASHSHRLTFFIIHLISCGSKSHYWCFAFHNTSWIKVWIYILSDFGRWWYNAQNDSSSTAILLTWIRLDVRLLHLSSVIVWKKYYNTTFTYIVKMER